MLLAWLKHHFLGVMQRGTYNFCFLKNVFCFFSSPVGLKGNPSRLDACVFSSGLKQMEDKSDRIFYSMVRLGDRKIGDEL